MNVTFEYLSGRACTLLPLPRPLFTHPDSRDQQHRLGRHALVSASKQSAIRQVRAGSGVLQAGGPSTVGSACVIAVMAEIALSYEAEGADRGKHPTLSALGYD